MTSRHITICGKPFTVENKYAVGQPMNEANVEVLFQRHAAGVANNSAKWIKEQIESGSFDQAAAQARVNEFAARYEPGAQTRGGRRAADQAMAIAFRNLLKVVRKQTLEKYGKGVYTDQEMADHAREVLRGPKGERYLHEARQAIELERRAKESPVDDLVSELGQRAAA